MKRLAIAKITDPTAVAIKAAAGGGLSDPGAVWVEIPELGFEGTDLIYCRYGLSIPFMAVQVNDKLWVEPSIDEDERWIYTGFADCGRTAAEPTSADQMLIDMLTNAIYSTTAGTLHLGSKTAIQPLVKGLLLLAELTKDTANWTALKAAVTAWVPAAGDGGAALKAALAAFLALPNGSYASINSTKVFTD